MLDVATVSLVMGTFLIAGVTKGVIGLGVPTISLGVLSATLGLQEAMSLMLIPALVTNLQQALSGGQLCAIVRRLWPFLMMTVPAIVLGVLVLRLGHVAALTALLGVVLVLYAANGLLGYGLTVHASQERWLSPFVGFVNGLLTGMTGSFTVPAVLYLQALGLARDVLIQAMGVVFVFSTLVLAAALQGHELLMASWGLLSMAATLPAVLGVVVGRRLRQRLSEQKFRLVFFYALLGLGSYIVLQAAL